MAISVDAKKPSSAAKRHGEPDLIQFRLLYVICFTLFLIEALIHRLLPWTWFTEQGTARRYSVFEQARNAAGVCATYVFMA